MIPTYKNRSLTIDVTVKESGAVKDITGATVSAVIRSPSGTKTTLTPTITDASGGVVQIAIPDNTIDAAGAWLGELVVTLSGLGQTVWQEPIHARDSIVE